MHRDCIILCHETDAAGNLLCLQEINGQAFIDYVALYLSKFHICKIIFSIGPQAAQFKEYILTNRDRFTFAFDFVEQKEEDKSGKAIVHALQYSDTPDVLILNGHTFFDVNIDDFIAWQQTKMGDVTLALVHYKNTEHETTAHLDEKNMIHEFKEGASDKSGLIIGGLFCLFRPSFLNINFSDNFSFEEDYIKKYTKERDFIGMISEGYYIDLSKEGSQEKASRDFPIIFKPTVAAK